ncbi:MAG: periplasmic heavy metal sensor [Deltaproteobacteria bacterium]|nr:periplasmic heavy metal sensor [Deltaproteobacteria bacterium]
MKSKWLIIVLFLSLAINAGVVVILGYHYYVNASTPSSAPCPMSPGDSHLYQSLGLSKVQLSKMEPLAQKFHARLAELGARMEERKETLTNLLQKESPPANIESLRKEMAAIQEDIQKEVISHIIESKKILDPVQQKRFFDLMRQSMTPVKAGIR